MRKCLLAFLLPLLTAGTLAHASGEPIIDMHLHSYDADNYYSVPDYYGRAAPATPDEHFAETYRLMKEHNIVLGVISNTRSDEQAWMAKDSEGLFLRGAGRFARQPEWTPDAFEEAVKRGEIKVLGELGAYYDGMTLNDPFYAPYLAICEKYGVPVAIHTGGGPPGTTYRGSPKARLFLSNPLHLEDVLNNYPKLDLYIMHAGEFYYEEALRLMLAYPRIYADLGVVLWVHELPKYYGEQFLLLAKRFGLLDRVMFGTDQMVWPHAISLSLEQLDSFDFLTEEDKRDVLYNNAARFLKLDQATIDGHHLGD